MQQNFLRLIHLKQNQKKVSKNFISNERKKIFFIFAKTFLVNEAKGENSFENRKELQTGEYLLKREMSFILEDYMTFIKLSSVVGIIINKIL